MGGTIGSPAWFDEARGTEASVEDLQRARQPRPAPHDRRGFVGHPASDDTTKRAQTPRLLTTGGDRRRRLEDATKTGGVRHHGHQLPRPAEDGAVDQGHTEPEAEVVD